MEGNGWSSSTGSMVLSASIAAGLTMYTGLEIWRENFGMDWKRYCLTTRDDVELRIELGNGTEPSLVWTYQLFRVGDTSTNYRLSIG